MGLATIFFLTPLPFAAVQDTRTPVTADPAPREAAEPSAPGPATAERALASLKEASVALAAWRERADRGEPVDAQRVEELLRELRAVGEHAQALYGRAQAQEIERAKAEEPRTARGQAAAPANDGLRPAANAIASAWTDDLRAFGEGSASRREQALKGIHAALGSGDETAALAALMALQRTGDVEFDKASFRPLVLPFTRQATGHTLATALYALHGLGIESGDLGLVHEAWTRDPRALEGSISHLLFLFGAGILEGRSEEIVLERLRDPGSRPRQHLSGLWGSRVGPRLEARLIELARSADPELRHDAIYFGLSTLQEKSEAVIDLLIETLADRDWANAGGRALWGLGQGVPEHLQPKVAAALVELHNARSDPKIRRDCARLVEAYGGTALIARLVR